MFPCDAPVLRLTRTHPQALRKAADTSAYQKPHAPPVRSRKTWKPAPSCCQKTGPAPGILLAANSPAATPPRSRKQFAVRPAASSRKYLRENSIHLAKFGGLARVVPE